MKEAASVPVAYVIAYYALKLRANIQPQSIVLINSALSTVGQACLQVARQMSCPIFATAGTTEEKQMLEKDLGIHPHHVVNVESCTDEIEELTHGTGQEYMHYVTLYLFEMSICNDVLVRLDSDTND